MTLQLVGPTGCRNIRYLSGDHEQDVFLTPEEVGAKHWELLIGCHHQGQCDDDVEEGFTTPTGAKITKAHVHNYAATHGLKKRGVRHISVIPAKLREQESRDNEALVSMIVGSALPKRKKLKALAALL